MKVNRHIFLATPLNSIFRRIIRTSVAAPRFVTCISPKLILGVRFLTYKTIDFSVDPLPHKPVLAHLQLRSDPSLLDLQTTAQSDFEI